MRNASDVITHLLATSGAVPNHPHWPLLVYQAAACDGLQIGRYLPRSRQGQR